MSQAAHAFTGAFTDKHRKNATYEVKAPYVECVKGVFMWERYGDPKGKRAGHKDKINETKKQENRIVLVWRVCGCGCNSQALEIVCDFKKEKGE